jgi:hypothetical protein
MKLLRRIFVLLAVAGALPATPQEIDTRPAMAAAEAWLALVDAGRYADSWEAAASIFREGIARPEWEKLAHAVRGGNAAGQRKLRAATHTTSLPGAPPGEYVVIQFDTPLANRPGAIETLATMREGGSWKVAGYFIR